MSPIVVIAQIWQSCDNKGMPNPHPVWLINIDWSAPKPVVLLQLFAVDGKVWIKKRITF